MLILKNTSIIEFNFLNILTEYNLNGCLMKIFILFNISYLDNLSRKNILKRLKIYFCWK